MYKLVGVINYLFVVFLNAFTDLGHKIIIQNTIFKVYDGDTQIVLTAIVNALILLPFILIFSPSGYLADRFAKNKIMEYAALFAVVITLAITYAYYHGYFLFAFAMTFMLALQSAIYGPAKYGYIKELVGEKYISSGNAAISAVTIVAILSGIMVYTVLFEGMYDAKLKSEAEILQAIAPLGYLLVAGSVLEWFLASKLPNKMLEASQRTFTLQRYLKGAYLRKNLKTITRKREIFDAIIALSLFWSISQVVLAVFPEYAKRELGITNTIFVQGTMALSALGIVFGSILAARLSKYFVNMGLVPIAAIGMTLIVVAVPFVHSLVVIALLFSLFGLFSGFLMVPLNSRIQLLASRIHLGVVLAGNNFIQNIFMFSFLMLTTLFAYNGMSSEYLFFMMALVGLYLVYLTSKRYIVRAFWSLMQILSLPRHHYSYHGLQNIPKEGAVLLLSNHVSWLDWILLQLPLSRDINYMMDREIYNWRLLHPLFVKGEAIPLSPKAFKDAFKEASRRLKEGKIVAIFPEGAISQDGKLGKFQRGFELLDAGDEKVTIIPVFIGGIFGSLFAKYKPKNAQSRFKRRQIDIYFGEPLPSDVRADTVAEVIQKMKEKYETQ